MSLLRSRISILLLAILINYLIHEVSGFTPLKTTNYRVSCIEVL